MNRESFPFPKAPWGSGLSSFLAVVEDHWDEVVRATALASWMTVQPAGSVVALEPSSGRLQPAEYSSGFRDRPRLYRVRHQMPDRWHVEEVDARGSVVRREAFGSDRRWSTGPSGTHVDSHDMAQSEVRRQISPCDLLHPRWVFEAGHPRFISQVAGRLSVEVIPEGRSHAVLPGWEGATAFNLIVDVSTGLGHELAATYEGRILRVQRLREIVYDPDLDSSLFEPPA